MGDPKHVDQAREESAALKVLLCPGYAQPPAILPKGTSEHLHSRLCAKHPWDHSLHAPPL